MYVRRIRLHGINIAKFKCVCVNNSDKGRELLGIDKQFVIIIDAAVYVYCCRLAWEQQ